MHAYFYHYPRAFAPEECEFIIEAAKAHDETLATTGHGGGVGTVTPEIRKSTKRWIPRHDPNTRFMFDRITLCILEANWKHFHLDIGDNPWLSFINAQFTTYDSTYEGKYDWHEDNCWVPGTWSKNDRKLSAVMLLSDPSTFKGGDLEIERASLPKLGRGDVVVFPSNFRHRVTPLEEGVRQSIVIWAEGPRLR